MIPAMGSSGLCHQSLRWEHAGWDRGGHLLLLRANSGQHLGLFCFAMILASLSGILRSPNCSRTLTLSMVAYQKAVCGEGLREAHSPHPYLPASAPGGLTALPQSLPLYHQALGVGVPPTVPFVGEPLVLMAFSLHIQSHTQLTTQLTGPKGVISCKPLQQHLQSEFEQMEEINSQHPLTKRLKEDLAETNCISLSEPMLPLGPQGLEIR